MKKMPCGKVLPELTPRSFSLGPILKQAAWKCSVLKLGALLEVLHAGGDPGFYREGCQDDPDRQAEIARQRETCHNRQECIGAQGRQKSGLHEQGFSIPWALYAQALQ